MEERCARDAEAAGSNPASPIKKEKEDNVHQPYMASGAMVQMVHDLWSMTSGVMVSQMVHDLRGDGLAGVMVSDLLILRVE